MTCSFRIGHMWSKSHLTRMVPRFSFNRNTRTPGPFDLKVAVEDHDTGEMLRWRKEGFEANSKVSCKFQNPILSYTIELRLDGGLAYRCECEEITSLF